LREVKYLANYGTNEVLDIFFNEPFILYDDLMSWISMFTNTYLHYFYFKIDRKYRFISYSSISLLLRLLVILFVILS